MVITLEQKAELMDIYPRVRAGHSDSTETTKRMVLLYNEIFGAGYKPNTSCTRCLQNILNKIIQLYEENQ